MSLRLIILLYAAGVLAGAASNLGRPGMTPVFMLSSMLAIATTTLPLFARFPNKGFLHPLVLTSAINFLNMAISQTGLFFEGLIWHQALRDKTTGALVDLAISVNLIAVVASLSTYLAFAFISSPSLPYLKLKNQPNRWFGLLFFIWLCAGLGCLAFIIYSSGGFASHIRNITVGAANQEFEYGAAYLGFASVGVQSMIVLPLVYAAFKKKGHRSFGFLLLIALVCASVFLLNGRRSAIIPPILSACAFWTFQEKRFPIVPVAVLVGVLVLFVGAGSMFREMNREQGATATFNVFERYTVEDVWDRAIAEITARSSTSSAVYPIVARVPQNEPYTYFKNYFDNIYRLIPSAFFPDQPDGIGIQAAETFYHRYDEGGIPPGTLGEAYWSFGILGVIVVYSSYGVLLRLLGNTMTQYRYSAGALCLYIITIVRLDFNQISIRIWLFTIVPMLIFYFASGLVGLRIPKD